MSARALEAKISHVQVILRPRFMLQYHVNYVTVTVTAIVKCYAFLLIVSIFSLHISSKMNLCHKYLEVKACNTLVLHAHLVQ